MQVLGAGGIGNVVQTDEGVRQYLGGRCTASTTWSGTPCALYVPPLPPPPWAAYRVVSAVYSSKAHTILTHDLIIRGSSQSSGSGGIPGFPVFGVVHGNKAHAILLRDLMLPF